MKTRLKTRAIALFSGGLDSLTATKLIMLQGVEIEAVFFHKPFCDCDSPKAQCKAVKSSAQKLGIPLHTVEFEDDFLALIRDPKHGYGKNINPCIDCRILQFRKAREMMPALGASFIITGEVLNERPMSQRGNIMDLIEREAGLDGLVLRPLSAKKLKQTKVEEKGIIDREKLLAIEGRCRKPQIALAKELGIDEYLAPSGGCFLTYQGAADKVRDLISHDQLDLQNVRMLKIGRHFRLPGKAKLIVGKDDKENEKLLTIKIEGAVYLRARDFPGPLGMLLCSSASTDVELAASIIAHYISKAGPVLTIDILYWQGEADQKTIASKKIVPAVLESLRIAKRS